MDLKKAISVLFFHDINNFVLVVKSHYLTQILQCRNRRVHTTRNKHLPMHFFHLRPLRMRSRLEIILTDGCALFPGTSKSIHCFCHAISFICGLWKQMTVWIATCACLFTETVQLVSLEGPSDLMLLPCTSDTQKYFANVKKGQAHNFLTAWESCNLFSKEGGELDKKSC